MAARKKKPWSADLPPPPWAGGPEHVAKPVPGTVTVGHSTPGAPAEHWECFRCERIRDGKMVDGELDHTKRCPYRGTGRDPDPKG